MIRSNDPGHVRVLDGDHAPAEDAPRLVHGHGSALPDKKTRKAPLRAFVNEGVWKVQCDQCGEGQIAAVTDPRFLCTNCRNESVGGLWRQVRFPKDRETIERLLGRRPLIRSRNWRDPETVADLKAENAAHGVG